MKIKEGFVLRDVCGDKVIVAEGLDTINFGRLLCLNDTAAWLWDEAHQQGQFSEESLVAALCEEYEVSKDQAEKDVKKIIDSWLEKHIIEE